MWHPSVISSLIREVCIYNGNGELVARRTILSIIKFVPSIPAFSNIFNFPDMSMTIPAHATREIFSPDKSIAVELRICLFNESKMESDLHQRISEEWTIPSIQFLGIRSSNTESQFFQRTFN